MATNEYISVDKQSRATQQVVKMTSTQNEFAGTLRTRNQNGGADDVNDVFVSEVKVNGQTQETETNQDGKKVVDIQVPEPPIKKVAVNGAELQPNGEGKVDVRAIQSLSLVGWGSGTEDTPGQDGGEIEAVEDQSRPGHFILPLEEIHFDELQANKLYLGDRDIMELIPNMSGVDGVVEAQTVVPDPGTAGFSMDELADKYNDLVGKFNQLVAALKSSVVPPAQND